jgi:hypothetical protein
MACQEGIAMKKSFKFLLLLLVPLLLISILAFANQRSYDEHYIIYWGKAISIGKPWYVLLNGTTQSEVMNNAKLMLSRHPYTVPAQGMRLVVYIETGGRQLIYNVTTGTDGFGYLNLSHSLNAPDVTTMTVTYPATDGKNWYTERKVINRATRDRSWVCFMAVS